MIDRDQARDGVHPAGPLPEGRRYFHGPSARGVRAARANSIYTTRNSPFAVAGGSGGGS